MPSSHVALSPSWPTPDEIPCAGLERDPCLGGDRACDDLPALQLVKVPDWGQPFDDELLPRPTAAMGIVSVAGVTGQPLAGAARAFASPARGAGTQRLDGSGEWSRQFARLLAEALAGARPIRQILPWTSERARVHLRNLQPLFASGQRLRVLRVIATRPTQEVIEMTVVVGVDGRTRALAVRLEQAAPRQPPEPDQRARWAGRATANAPGWVCTDIEAA